MASGDWNFLAGRLVGDGSIDILETELPIEIDSIDRRLSAPSTMNGSINNAVRRLKKDGVPIFQEWNTVIIAEAAGLIRGMTIYRRPTFTGPVWDLDQIGLPGYAIDMPYDSYTPFLNADPLDIFRHIWEHLQSFENGNLGITVSDLTSPVRVGTPIVDGDNNSGPRVLSWWETLDLGGVIDQYARETPFDWRERLFWDGDQPRCHIDLGYPQIGGVKDYRLVLGENLATQPSFVGGDVANQAVVLGAGEGRDRVRGYAGVSDGRIRRVNVVEDRKLTHTDQANSRAAERLAAVRGDLIVDELEVYDHPNAPLEALELGDEIPLYAETDHITVDQTVRIVGKSESPTKSDVARLTVVRQGIV